jgi:hypothetical protein
MFIERATRTPEVAAVSRHKVRFKILHSFENSTAVGEGSPTGRHGAVR